MQPEAAGLAPLVRRRLGMLTGRKPGQPRSALHRDHSGGDHHRVRDGKKTMSLG